VISSLFHPISGTPHRRRRRAPGRPLIALAALTLLSAGLAAGCARSEPASQRATDDSGQITAAEATRLPVVCLLGGSAARESTVDDASWAAEIEGLSGRAVDAYNLGTRNQTFATDVGYVEVFPAEWDGAGIVFIGVSVGRFTGNRRPGTPADHVVDPSVIAHREAARFGDGDMLGREQRRQHVEGWLRDRYPSFGQHYDESLETLELLVETCLVRDLHPVLLELPRDQTAVGDLLDEPIARYQGDCRTLAAGFGIPYVDFLDEAGLVHEDFIDVNHLSSSGRGKWQHLLSEAAADLLEEYRL